MIIPKTAARIKIMKIEEGNRLIADFIGYEKDFLAEEGEEPRYFVYDHLECIADGVDWWDTVEMDWSSWLYPKDMKFHFSWDWLMPVVERIENKGYDVFINGLYCRITDCGLSDFEIESTEVSNKREAVFKAVVEFIKWYNENEKIKV
jgi:hypothetical protein